MNTNNTTMEQTESASADSVQRLVRTYEPTMVTKAESDWESLNEIADACQRLCAAVTARMSSDEPDGKKVWEMFQAHGHAVNVLRHRPNTQAGPPVGPAKG